jgi:rhodanese-related sulfurtransferase
MKRSILFNTLCALAVSALLSSCAARKTASNTDATTDTGMVSATTESGTAPAARVNAVGKIQTVNTKQFNQLLLLDEVQVVDVRTPEEYAGGHIENAVNIDVNSDSFASEVSKLDKEKPVLVYCRSGKRSLTAAEKLREMGFTRIVNLEGGMLGWEEAKMPVTTESE